METGDCSPGMIMVSKKRKATEISAQELADLDSEYLIQNENKAMGFHDYKKAKLVDQDKKDKLIADFMAKRDYTTMVCHDWKIYAFLEFTIIDTILASGEGVTNLICDYAYFEFISYKLNIFYSLQLIHRKPVQVVFVYNKEKIPGMYKRYKPKSPQPIFEYKDYINTYCTLAAIKAQLPAFNLICSNPNSEDGHIGDGYIGIKPYFRWYKMHARACTTPNPHRCLNVDKYTEI